MARHRLLHCSTSLVLLLVGLLLCSSAVARATATPTPESHSYRRSRKLLVTEPRVSPDTRSTSSIARQEMDVSGWRTATPFRRAGASFGRRVPGSHANPSHN